MEEPKGKGAGASGRASVGGHAMSCTGKQMQPRDGVFVLSSLFPAQFMLITAWDLAALVCL